MKKIILAFFLIMIFPITIFAYSKYIIPGGESIGIKINSNGLIVVGFYKVDGEYINKNNINIGDIITKVNGIYVEDLDDFGKKVTNLIPSEEDINVELIRNGKTISTSLYLKKDGNIYKTGLYIKESVIGLGTLTYIDPESKIFGSLGHEIILSETRNKVSVKSGNIFKSKVTSIDKSRNGYVGSKNATLSYKNILGNITVNSNKGLYGIYTDTLPNKELYEVADFSEIEIGEAYILTVTSNDKIEKYKIKITDKYNNKKDTQKAFSFEIVDKKLLSKTGGVVQGMSGSPIIQNNKLIGAVTNVLVDDVKYGYGISIITMLEEQEKVNR